MLDLWSRISPFWGRAREVRHDQPLLAITSAPRIQADPQVRPVTPAELDSLLPACVTMFTEEVGISPVSGGSGGAYRARIAELIGEGRALARFDDSTVVFKAEIGAMNSRACQVQGVWVAPERRGQGLAEPGMAAVVDHARTECAPIVSLYVNDYNRIARRVYERVGFEQVGVFATILF